MKVVSRPGRERSISEPTESRRSVLDQVRAQLNAREDVYVGGEVLTSPAGPGWTETVDILVAPVSPIYDPDKLNVFMDGLITGIQLSARDEAHDYMDGGIHFGMLYFDEDLGMNNEKIISHVTAFEPEALLRAGIKIGRTTRDREERLRRRTWVRVYPDSVVCQIAAQYEQGVREGTIEPDSTFSYLQHWITPEQVRELKRRNNPFAKIAGLLGR